MGGAALPALGKFFWFAEGRPDMSQPGLQFCVHHVFLADW
jgi:hypothetical protein